MGSVFVARQRSTGRLCALKVMLGPLAEDAKLRERFLLEARLPAQLSSPHIVDFVASGVDAERGAPWLAMELLEGADLRRHVERCGALPLEQVRHFLAQLGEALGLAHRHSVVHRDLKPQNVFVVGGGAGIKVLDFGIAKVVNEATRHTTAALGSPAWMAPEQTEPGGDICPGTDVWALGLLSFFMITGRPFWRSIAVRGGAPKVLREVLFAPIPLGSFRSRELPGAAAFPEVLDPWLARCLDRHPRARFATATEAQAAFDAALRGELPATVAQPTLQPVSPAPPARPTPFPKALAAGLTAGAILLGGVIGGIYVLASKPSTPPAAPFVLEDSSPPSEVELFDSLYPEHEARMAEAVQAQEVLARGEPERALALAEASLAKMRQAGLTPRHRSPIAAAILGVAHRALRARCEARFTAPPVPATFDSVFRRQKRCSADFSTFMDRQGIVWWAPNIASCAPVHQHRAVVTYAEWLSALRDQGELPKAAHKGHEAVVRAALSNWVSPGEEVTACEDLYEELVEHVGALGDAYPDLAAEAQRNAD